MRNDDRFRFTLLAWFRKNGRDLPWRQTRDPYAILVSEFMLQQTQVATVLPYYERWLRRFPDFPTLAKATESQVLHAWQGLGYYARVRNLHAAAKTVTRKFGSKLPANLELMSALPGIGKYTAGAVATFAFNRPVPIVEANIARVLARLTNLQTPIDSSDGRNELWRRASALIPTRGARDYNSALIDLGALVCLPRQPRCQSCPVTRFCRAQYPNRLPIKKSKPATVRFTQTHGFVMQRGRVLLEKSRARWGGMWILPHLENPPVKNSLLTEIFPFTHHRITLAVFYQSPPRRVKRDQRWFSVRDLEAIPVPSPHRRALVKLLAAQKLCSTFSPA
jgi:A/G-specific adenine glycosylase